MPNTFVCTPPVPSRFTSSPVGRRVSKPRPKATRLAGLKAYLARTTMSPMPGRDAAHLVGVLVVVAPLECVHGRILRRRDPLNLGVDGGVELDADEGNRDADVEAIGHAVGGEHH